MGGFVKDFGYAIRALGRAPGFTATSALTLGLGIGGAAAVFTVIDAVLLEPLPFDDPDELVALWHVAPGVNDARFASTGALHFVYREESRVFEDVGHWIPQEVAVTGLESPEQLPALRVTAGLLPLLGVEPILGRRFTEEDDRPDASGTILLAEGYWRQRLGGDRDVLGRTLQVDGVPREIVGVLPADLSVPGARPDLYLPMQWDRGATVLANFTYNGVARLRRGTTLEEANRDVARMIPMAPERFPGAMTADNVRLSGLAPDVRPLREEYVGDVGDILWILFGSVGLLLLIALANVASLVLVRTEGRARELAVRAALGAGRGRIARQFLAESLLLGALGGIVGLASVVLGIEALVQMRPEGLPRLSEISVDGSVLTFVVGLSLAAGTIWAAMMALGQQRRDLAQALRAGGQPSAAADGRGWIRRSLVVAQVAFALVLLIGSALMLRSVQELRRVEPGFTDPEDVLTFRLALAASAVPSPDQVALTYQDIQARLLEIPGVAAVGAASSLTMDASNREGFIWSEDRPISMDVAPPLRRFKWITPGYFEAMGNPLLVGRSIEWPDVREQARVAVVTRSFAEEYWGGPGAALGMRIATGDPAAPIWREIVGVVGDVHDDGVARPATPVVYWPHAWEHGVTRAMSFAVRAATGRSATSLVEDVEAAVWSVNGSLPIANVRPLDAILAMSTARTSFIMVVLLVAAVVAMSLGLIGIYGVVSYVVAQRTREIGVRVALGAGHRDIRRMVLGQGILLAAAGVALGLAAAAGLTRLMASLLYGVEPTDPWAFGGVALLLTAVALVATWLPARRAARVDPLVALRFD